MANNQQVVVACQLDVLNSRVLIEHRDRLIGAYLFTYSRLPLGDRPWPAPTRAADTTKGLVVRANELAQLKWPQSNERMNVNVSPNGSMQQQVTGTRCSGLRLLSSPRMESETGNRFQPRERPDDRWLACTIERALVHGFKSWLLCDNATDSNDRSVGPIKAQNEMQYVRRSNSEATLVRSP
jgi:hypothetical protein